MSGRSAYVRKQKAPGRSEQPFSPRSSAHSTASSTQYAWESEPFVSGPPTLPTLAEHTHYHGPQQQYVPALSIIELDYDRSPPTTHRSPSRARANSIHARSGTSMSSWSSADGSSSQPSRIEKSALRAFVDSKSEALRSRLTFRSSSRKPSVEQLQVRPSRSATTSRAPYTPYLTAGPSQGLFELPASPRPRTPPDRIRMAPAHEIGGLGERGTTLPQGNHRYGEHLSSVKRWTGGGKLPQPWSKLRKDPELWDPTGDTLVYLGHEAHGITRPGPSLRVHSSVLEDTGSVFFSTILREGYLEQRDYDLPVSPESPSPSALMAGPEPAREAYARIGRPESDPPLSVPHPGTRVPLPGLHSLHQRGGQPTPPTSESSLHDRDHAVLYELFFPAPLDASTVEILRHHLTTRNVFALLFGKSLVGLNLYQSLLDLHERLQMYMPTESDNASLIIDHIVSNGFDDVRNDPASAAGLLAWSEGAMVRWHEGWREAFVHCTGMYGRLKLAPEFRDVSHFSRILLERANLEIQVRVQQAADKLVDFDFADMWPMQSVLSPAARDAFERCRRFMARHYEAVFWSWPPLPRFGTAESWLTRDVISRLQTDFAALYDYLVDRDMAWDTPPTTTTTERQQWRMVSKGLKPHFRPDADGLPMTDMLVGFDNRHGYPHIPHPYPLLPPSQPLQIPSKPARFGKKAARPAEVRFIERRVALDYSEATNVFRLGPEFEANHLVESFSNFEKSDLPGEVDPAQARKGRWVLIYGVLQVLANVSVDTPGLRYKDKVQYYVNPRLRGTPPWRDKRDPPPDEATHEHSHCWTVPRTWKEPDHAVQQSGLRNHREILIKGLGDGTGRTAVSALSSPGNGGDDTASRTESPRPPQWTVTAAAAAEKAPLEELATLSRRGSREKVTDWPIRSQPAARRVRALGLSDYVPPDDW